MNIQTAIWFSCLVFIAKMKTNFQKLQVTSDCNENKLIAAGDSTSN